MKCSICGKEIIGDRHNSSPYMRGDCCSDCHYNNVMKLRMYLITDDNKQALLIKTDGTLEYVSPNNKKYFKLKQLQRLVEGNIELYPQYDPKFFFVVNEEGLLERRKHNKLAFELFNAKVVGNMLICPRDIFENEDDDEGE